MSNKQARVYGRWMPDFDWQSGSKRLFDFVIFLRCDPWSVTFLAVDITGQERYVTIPGSKEWRSIWNRPTTSSQVTSTWLCWRSGTWPNGFCLSYAVSHLIHGYSSTALISTSSAKPSVSVPEPLTMYVAVRPISTLSQRGRHIRRAARWNERIAHSVDSA